jgi:hypothetical protein
MRKSYLHTFCLTFSVIVALTLNMLPNLSEEVSYAKAIAHSSAHITKVTIPMKVIQTSNAKGIIPAGSTTLDCGNLTLWIFDAGDGDANFYVSVSSTKGFIFSLTYTVNWTNVTEDFGNSFGHSYSFPSNPFSNTETIYTQEGFVTASVTARDWVGGIPPFGQACGPGYENDYETIT